MNEPLTVYRDGPVSEITLARPGKANALSAELVERLLAAIETTAGNGTRVLVLRGEGRNFCAGFDFSDIDSTTDGELLHRFVRTELMLQALYHAPFSTLALCHGGVYGAGADIVAACDRRIAAPGSRFRMPGLKFGIALGTRRLAERIGADRALEIQGSARIFDAEEAMRIGFAHAVEPQERWSTIVAQVAGAQKLQPAAHALLKERVQSDTRDADLAALIRSAGIPGLKDRIKAFRAERE
ncbi:MAG: enoyl-CoA hydratase/isomerase family protein [Hyphomicrobiaceae bacterium]|nr:enoyl-CoA hydratase/isomerase family protein [Hyphomicrobiaceae bacterium]